MQSESLERPRPDQKMCSNQCMTQFWQNTCTNLVYIRELAQLIGVQYGINSTSNKQWQGY